MLPTDSPSAIDLPSRFLPPDDEVVTPIEDFEWGGIALNDSSQGLTLQKWRCHLDATDIYVSAPSTAPILLFSQPNITELAFTFDQNMRPTVVYRLGGEVFLRWYDSMASEYITTNFGPGMSPRVSLDDKREMSRNTSDVILAYLRNGTLYYRQQRDRYLSERTLRTGLPLVTKIRNIGMSRTWRLQFELV